MRWPDSFLKRFMLVFCLTQPVVAMLVFGIGMVRATPVEDSLRIWVAAAGALLVANVVQAFAARPGTSFSSPKSVRLRRSSQSQP